MDRRRFSILVALISAAVGAATGFLVASDKASYAAVFPLAGTLLVYLLRSKVRDVIEDEMIEKYVGKASKKTIDVLGISMAILGLIFLGYKRVHPEGDSRFHPALFHLLYAGSLLFLILLLYQESGGRRRR
jgi:uncharacterized membrane protein